MASRNGWQPLENIEKRKLQQLAAGVSAVWRRGAICEKREKLKASK